MGLMSDQSDFAVQLEFTLLFKRRLRGLAKKYRQIQTDIQPVLEQLVLGERIGDRVSGTTYTVYKIRARNSDTQSGKSGGYRLIYQIVSPAKFVLHLIYTKSEQATVTAEEIRDMIETYQQEREQKE